MPGSIIIALCGADTPKSSHCAGKTAEQVAAIFTRLALASPRVLGTRATAEQAAIVRDELGECVQYDWLAALYGWISSPIAFVAMAR